MTTAQPLIKIETRRFTPSTPFSPSFALQITQLTDTYMLWVGTVPPSAAGEEEDKGPVLEARLARDWACAMPGRNVGVPAVSTSLFRSPTSDVALSLAQRLARRFKKQVFLSVDLADAGGGVNDAGRVMLEVERRLVETLIEVEKRAVPEKLTQLDLWCTVSSVKREEMLQYDGI